MASRGRGRRGNPPKAQKKPAVKRKVKTPPKAQKKPAVKRKAKNPPIPRKKPIVKNKRPAVSRDLWRAIAQDLLLSIPRPISLSEAYILATKHPSFPARPITTWQASFRRAMAELAIREDGRYKAHPQSAGRPLPKIASIRDLRHPSKRLEAAIAKRLTEGGLSVISSESIVESRPGASLPRIGSIGLVDTSGMVPQEASYTVHFRPVDALEDDERMLADSVIEAFRAAAYQPYMAGYYGRMMVQVRMEGTSIDPRTGEELTTPERWPVIVSASNSRAAAEQLASKFAHYFATGRFGDAMKRYALGLQITEQITAFRVVMRDIVDGRDLRVNEAE